MRATLARIAVGLALLGATANAQDVPTGREPGQRFPSVRLPVLADGRMTALASFRGRKVLLFEFASW